MVVCNSLHPALPSSAFNVSLPILLVMTSPFSTSSSTLTWCMGTVLNFAFEGCDENVQLRRETKPIAAMRRMRKRRFEVVLGVGIVA